MKRTIFFSPAILCPKLLACWCGYGGVELDHLGRSSSNDDIAQVRLGRGIQAKKSVSFTSVYSLFEVSRVYSPQFLRRVPHDVDHS